MSADRRVVYLDSSAIVKLVITEGESAALRRYVAGASRALTSRIAVVEVHRAIRRQGEQDAVAQATAVFGGLDLIELDAEIADTAGELGSPPLRSLDAIHIASALALGEELDEVVTYDARQADGARQAGLHVVAPA